MNEICELVISLCRRFKPIRQMAAQYAFIERLAMMRCHAMRYPFCGKIYESRKTFYYYIMSCQIIQIIQVY